MVCETDCFLFARTQLELKGFCLSPIANMLLVSINFTLERFL